MKKLFILLLAGAAALALCGCSEAVDEVLADMEQAAAEIAAQEERTVNVEFHSGMVQFGGENTQMASGDLQGDWVNEENGNIIRIDEKGNVTKTDSSGEPVQTDGAEQLVLEENEEGMMLQADDGPYRKMDHESLLTRQGNYLTLGQTAKTDQVELTLTSIEFADMVSTDADRYLLPTNQDGMTPDSGCLYACLSFRMKNVSDYGIGCCDACCLEMEYDHQDHYDECILADISGQQPNLLPESSMDCRAVIACDASVAEQDDAFLSLNVILPSSEGDVLFSYILK